MAKANGHKAEKKVRVVRTNEERIADLEAQLAAARDRVHAKDRKRHAVLTEQLQKATERQAEQAAKIVEISAELSEIEARLPVE